MAEKYIPYALTDELFSELALVNGASVLVLPHSDPTRVWILSFDMYRFFFLEELGIDVADYSEHVFDYRDAFNDTYGEYALFSCEKLAQGYAACEQWQEVYAVLKDYLYEGDSKHPDDWGCVLPQQHEALENFLYAYYKLQPPFDVWDEGAHNTLYGPIKKKLYLSDIAIWEDSLCPEDIYCDLSQFDHILETIGVKKDVLAIG